MVQNTINTSAAILVRAFSTGRKEMSPELAAYLLTVKLDPADAERANQLAQKARTGTLTPNEECEIDEYRRVGRVIETLKLRALNVIKASR